MRLSYRQFADRYERRGAQIERLIAERDAFEKNAKACAAAMRKTTAELSRMKDVVALHIVAAGHSSTVLHDPKRIGEALREELAANRVDLRLELARLEGADL